MVALQQHAHGVAALLGGEAAGGGADAALELVADHAGAPADVAFRHGAAARRVEGVEHIFGVNVESVHVV